LSQHTIKNYLFRIYDKLGVSSRLELLFMTLTHAGAAQSELQSEMVKSAHQYGNPRSVTSGALSKNTRPRPNARVEEPELHSQASAVGRSELKFATQHEDKSRRYPERPSTVMRADPLD